MWIKIYVAFHNKATLSWICTYAVFFFWPTANSAILRCYECSSRSSWDHCNDSQVVTDCLSNEDHCAQFLVQAYNPISGSSKENYFRNCTSKRVCQRLQTSQVCDDFRSKTSGARISCLVFCSSGNRSNGGKLPGIDALINKILD